MLQCSSVQCRPSSLSRIIIIIIVVYIQRNLLIKDTMGDNTISAVLVLSFVAGEVNYYPPVYIYKCPLYRGLLHCDPVLKGPQSEVST